MSAPHFAAGHNRRMSDMANFTDQKPHTVTKKNLKGRWGGGRDGKYFRCGICGYRFKLGDIYRWILTNDIPGYGGNPLVCQKCDGPDVLDKWKSLVDEFNKIYNDDKFWKLRRS